MRPSLQRQAVPTPGEAVVFALALLLPVGALALLLPGTGPVGFAVLALFLASHAVAAVVFARGFRSRARELEAQLQSEQRRVEERTRELEQQAQAALEYAQELTSQRVLLDEQRARLEKLSRARTDFLAFVSHELRTPLNAIIGFSDLLLEGAAGPLQGEQTSYVTDVRTAGKHQLAIINDILDLAKADAGRLELKVQLLTLADPVREAAAMVESLARQKGVALSLELDPSLRVEGDPLRVRQVAINLMSNALKFTPKQGQVKVKVGRSRTYGAELSVQDTGIGIAPEFHAEIFESFHQVDSSVGREYGGTGLGLALVKRLVESMAGEVSLESSLGHGSTFRVEFPIPETVPLLVRDLASASASQVQVLVAEDDSATRHLLARVLAANGWSVRSASNGQRTLEAIAERLPDVLVLDLMMPELDGYQVLERLRGFPGGPAVEVLAFSAAVPEEANKRKLKELGASLMIKGSVATQQIVAWVHDRVEARAEAVAQRGAA